MAYTKLYKAYILIDPNTNIPRYVGVTKQGIGQRFSGHMYDISYRPELNPHKTAWFHKLMDQNKLPIIQQIAEFDTEFEMKQFEIEYIKLHKTEYKLVNLTKGGDYFSEYTYSREAILKKKNTRAVTQYNILGEKIADYEIMEDIGRIFNLRNKACSHITQCCKGIRKVAYGYIWRYKDEELGDISNINPKSLEFNKIVQYDSMGNRITEYDSYRKASIAIGDNSKGGNIAACCFGYQRTCKGFMFKLEPIYVYYDQNLYNAILNTNAWKQKASHSKEVLQYTEDGKILQKYTSMYIAAEQVYGSSNYRTNIAKCCQNFNLVYKGYKWKFSDGSL